MTSNQGSRKRSILFVCVENSSRSIMAEAFARKMGFEASSAGTVPSTHVNPLVVDAMGEVGIDVSDVKPRALTEEMIQHADSVVLTDASLEKAIPRGLRGKMRKKVVHWSVPDPQGRSIEEVRFLRDMIQEKVGDLLKASDRNQ